MFICYSFFKLRVISSQYIYWFPSWKIYLLFIFFFFNKFNCYIFFFLIKMKEYHRYVNLYLFCKPLTNVIIIFFLLLHNIIIFNVEILVAFFSRLDLYELRMKFLCFLSKYFFWITIWTYYNWSISFNDSSFILCYWKQWWTELFNVIKSNCRYNWKKWINNISWILQSAKSHFQSAHFSLHVFKILVSQ